MTLLLVFWLALTSAAAPQPSAPPATVKKLTFTTRSEVARSAVVEALRRLEAFEGGARIREQAQMAINADPDFAFAHYLLASNSQPASAGDVHMEKARALAEKATDLERRYIEAMGLLRSKKTPEAVALLEALRREYPDERLVHFTLGQIAYNKGQLEAACESLERSIALDPGAGRAYVQLGHYFLLKEDYAKAREQFKAARARQSPTSLSFGPHAGLAFSYIYEGNPDAAVAVLESFRDAYAKSAGEGDLPIVFIWNAMARIRLEHGQLDAALAAYEKGYQSVASSRSTLDAQQKRLWLGRLHHGSGRTLARMGRHQEAADHAATLKKMIDEAGETGTPYRQAYHYLTGYLNLEKGALPEAIEELKQADPADLFHRLLLARAYDRSGEKALARSIYQEIVASTQSNLDRALTYPEAKRRLESLG